MRPRLAITGLIRIELPALPGLAARTVRLCNGGVIFWGSEIFRGVDPLFGSITMIDGGDEGTGDQVPAMDVEFQPPMSAPIGELSRPGYQTAPAYFWTAEYDISTSTVIGTPVLGFLGQLDQTALTLKRVLKTTVVSQSERLFAMNRGSPLNPTAHKAIWPGETGEDNATGLTRQISWGVTAPTPTVATVVPGVGGVGYGGRFAA